MIKRIVAVVSAALLTFILAGCSFTERDLIEVTHNIEVPPKMLFLGDSIAAGYGLEGYAGDDNYSCRSYSNILKDRYTEELRGQTDHTMVNKAVSGATSSDLLELLESGSLDSDLKDTDAVVVSIGGNDLLGILYRVFDSIGFSPEQGSFDIGELDLFSAAAALYTMGGDIDKALDGFEGNLQKIASEIHSRSDAVLYIQTLYNPLEYFSDIQLAVNFSDDKLGSFNSIVKENSGASYSGYRVVDVAERFKGQNSELTNIKDIDIHPNAEGHKVIAEEVDKAFRATGFSYTTHEYGEEHLTSAGKAAAWGIPIGAAALIAVIAVLIARKKAS